MGLLQELVKGLTMTVLMMVIKCRKKLNNHIIEKGLLQELAKGFVYYSNDDDGLFLDGSCLSLSPPLSPLPI